MVNKSSKPSPAQDIRKTEPKQPSSTSSVSGSAGAAAAAASQDKKPSRLSESGAESGVINKIAYAADKESRIELAGTSRWHRSVIYDPLATGARVKKITQKLLQAVANGMESRTVKVDPKPHDLFVEDLLRLSPEFLLEKGDFTDWGGRTFKNITAFQYALWARDFKMIERMLKCIPVGEEGDAIRTELLRQYEQVTMPRYQGGGLTYTHTYGRPKVNEAGVPIKVDEAGMPIKHASWDSDWDWDCETVTEERWGNHFDITPLINVYEDYEHDENYAYFGDYANYEDYEDYEDYDESGDDDTNFDAPTLPDSTSREACWIKVIGTQQRLLPVHILQRYCDPDTSFDPLPSFTGNFKRTTQFDSYLRGAESLLSSALSSDFSLFRGSAEGVMCTRFAIGLSADLAAVRQLDIVSTNEIEKIKQLLATPGESLTQFRP